MGDSGKDSREAARVLGEKTEDAIDKMGEALDARRSSLEADA